MFSRRALSGSLILAALALPFAAGCSGAAVEQPAATTSGLSTGPLSVTVHGRAKAVVDALAQVPLRTDQRTAIEQLATDTEAKSAPVRKAREELMVAVADQVQTGTIDRTALQPKIDAVATSWEAARPSERAAFERLHAILNADQRAALVTALQAKTDAHAGHGEHMQHMQRWVSDLSLTPDQQDQIRAKLADKWRQHAVQDATAAGSGADSAQVAGGQLQGIMRHRAMRAQQQKMLEAFKGDTFSMDAVAPPQDVHAGASEMSGRMLEMAEAVLPILTPEQRTLAAAKLRERAAHFDEE